MENEGHIVNKLPMFKGQNYDYWKQRIMAFFDTSHIDMWDIMENDNYIPTNKGAEISRSSWNVLIWIELDQYQGLKMCKVDSIAYIRFVERERIFKFLHGLNSEYDPIRVQILGKEKLPSLSEVPQKDQPPKENPSQRVVVENIIRIANDHDIPRISTTSFMERRKFLNK
ncbi:hypothetical protein CR513_24406, partial [Mucuna pruriens]